MAALCLVLFWLAFVRPSLFTEVNFEETDEFSDDNWMFHTNKSCMKVKPYAKDIVRRIYAIIPYFDKDHTNSVFLHKHRATLTLMSASQDMLDREAAFYAAIFTPLVFLQQYRDAWCLMERFHRALKLYEQSTLTEKRSALKILQNIRAINQKIRNFIFELPGPVRTHHTQLRPTIEIEDDIRDNKDVHYLKELIKNLG